MRIEYKKFSFIFPRQIIQSDYEIAKRIFNSGSTHTFEKKSTTLDDIKPELIGCLVALIGPLLFAFNAKGIIELLAIFLSLITLGAVFSLFPTVISYIEFRIAKHFYYKNLSKDIIRSIDYEDFYKKRKKRGYRF